MYGVNGALKCLQDLEEVEEWNEYGELKENVNLPGPAKAATATPTPSAANTPSKAPVKQAPTSTSATADQAPDSAATSTPDDSVLDSTSTAKAESTTPSADRNPSTPTSATSTLSMAMRQAGLEAAKKASDAKTKARQEELEKLKAKSAEMQKSDGSEPSVVLPPGGTKDTEDAKKPESGGTMAADAADEVSSTKEKEGIEAAESLTATDPKSSNQDASQIEKAANEEMAKAANEASTGAAEPDVLEGTGQAEPEATPTKTEPVQIPAVKEPEQPAKHAEPQRILNAKEAEEEANKAIIADEATHVHIAGSPPPHASPGMKYPRDESQDSIPPSAALKDKVEQKETGKLTKEEDEDGKVDGAETTVKSDHDDGKEMPVAAATEPAEKVEKSTEANTEQNKMGAAGTVLPLIEDDKADNGRAEPKHTIEESPTKEASNVADEATPDTDIGQTDSSKHEDPIESTEPTQANPPTATLTDDKPTTPGPKTQEQPAASGDKAGESVAD